MNENYIVGIGFVAKAIGELLVDKNPKLAFTDFMKGLGMFGLHDSIKAAMQAPPALQQPPDTVKK